MKYIEIIRKLKIDFRDLDSLQSACLGRMFTVQSRLEKVTTTSNKTRVELNNCSLFFDDIKYNIQLLGFQNNKNVWIWGWDEKTELNPELFDFCNMIKDFSEVYFIDYARRTSYVPNDKDFVRNMTATLCTLFDDYCTFKIPAEQGSLYVAVKVSKEMLAPADLQTFIGISNHCLKNVKMNHRLFFEGFLLWNNIPYEYDGNAIVAQFESEVRIEFMIRNEQYLATKMEVKKNK